MAGWIAEMLFMLFFFLLILLCNGQNIAKYEAYCLIGVTIILEVHTNHFSLQSGMLKLTNQNYYVFKKVNKQV